MATTSSSNYNPTNGVYTSPRPPISFPSNPNLSMVSFLFDQALTHYPHRPALIDAHSAQTLTFLQLHSLVSSFSVALSSPPFQIKKGDVILIFAPNSLLFPVSFFSILKVGAIATTINPLYTTRELQKQVFDSQAKLVITIEDLLPKSQSLNLPTILLSSSSSNFANNNNIFLFSELIQNKKNIVPNNYTSNCQDDTVALLYSSGTTGASKGVILTHKNFITTAMMVGMDQDLRGEGFNTFLCFLPMFHIFGLSVITFGQLVRGNCVVVMERFEMELMLRCIERFKVNYMFAVPPVMIALVKQGKVKGYDLSSLRWLGSGAAPLGKEVMEELGKLFPQSEIVQVSIGFK